MLSAEWSGKLQALLEAHSPVPKLQPMGGPVKPSDAADPTSFGMINTPVCVCVCVFAYTYMHVYFNIVNLRECRHYYKQYCLNSLINLMEEPSHH